MDCLRRFQVIFFSVILPFCQVLAEDDTQCLQKFKNSVHDPLGALSNWNFGNVSNGYICSFYGISCWNALENKVLSLKIKQAGFSGNFPEGLRFCGSLQSLDLSNNQFSGNIPTDICDQIPYMTSLDLSGNDFSGSIPVEFEKCKYLNVLRLEENQLSGEIPWQIGTLPRLSDLNLSSNLLQGPIPSSYTNRTEIQKSSFSASAFSNNPGLCGAPLSKSCTPAIKTGLVIGTTVTAAAILALIFALFLWWHYNGVQKDERTILRDEHKWAKCIKAPKSMTVSLFEKPLVKLKLSDIMVATNDFSKDNIIASGRTGTVFIAVLRDGSMLAVKRLSPSVHSDKQFKSEMDVLGKLRHRNLVPLLGYCVAGSEKLLVYKHMVNGSLKDLLHETPEGCNLDWLTRLKIGIGASCGLAWLHHNCNPRIIHRNISSNCILLDDDYEPRITDFGLARLMHPAETHISTFINGDFGDVGYMAPEYTRTLVATVKGDVYSFGIVLLELVTGQKANDVCTENPFKGNLAEWVTFLLSNGRVEEAIDKSLKSRGFDNEIDQFLRIACACIHAGPKERPSMYEVYQMLRAIGQKCNLTDNDDLLPLIDFKELESIDELVVVQGN